MVAQATVLIDEVARRPITLAIGAPDRAVVIHHDRILDTQVLRCLNDVAEIFFVIELWIMHADHGEAVTVIFAIPFLHRRNHMLAINSAKRPELYQDNFTA